MNEKQRAAFEKHMKSNDIAFSGRKGLDGEYFYSDERKAFGLWQAAIASVVVDIKSLPSASYTSSGVVYLSDVAEAIEKAGVRHNDE